MKKQQNSVTLGLSFIFTLITMRIHKLTLTQFRNIVSATMQMNARFNLVYGENGSGKSSILEALHFLSHGRSFRTQQIKRIIQHDKDQFVLFTEIEDETRTHQIGLSRSNTEEAQIKLNGSVLPSHSAIIQYLPTILINPDSFSLFTDGAKQRRQMIDWGVFHSQPEFMQTWQQLKRVIAQRNALLKSKPDKKSIDAWTPSFKQLAEQVNTMRKTYIEALIEIIHPLITQLLDREDIRLSFYQGWSKSIDFEEALAQSWESDITHGYTHIGPQRADLRLRVNQVPVQDHLSRGQQKMLLCALKLAQGIHLKEHYNKTCLYLLDDITAELDDKHLTQLFGQLNYLQSQVFITSISPENMIEYMQSDWQFNLFKMMDGCLSPDNKERH